MGKGSAPPPPDYTGAAKVQGAADLQTARAQGKLNNPSFTNALGSRKVEFGFGGDPDSVNITDSLTPAGQAQFDTQQRISGQLGNIAESGINRVGQGFEKSFDTSSLPDRVNNVEASDATRQRVEQALMDRQQPIFDRQRAQLETQLANQGIGRGSEAYTNAMSDQNMRENDANLATIAQAGQEESRLFGMGMQNASLANQGREQSIQEQAYLRSLPLNELNALRTGSQVSMPQFQQYSGAGNVKSPDLFGATQSQYDAQLGGYNADQARRTNNTNAGIGLAAALMLSDRRLKENIKEVGKLDSGLTVYTFSYKGTPGTVMGVMADEAEKVFPNAIHTRDDGYKMVDYSQLS